LGIVHPFLGQPSFSMRRWLLAIVVALAWAAPGAAQAPVAVLTGYGEAVAVETRPAVEGRWRPLQGGALGLAEGDSIRVRQGGEAVVLFRDGRSVTLPAGSRYRITTLAEATSRRERAATSLRSAVGALLDFVSKETHVPDPRIVAMQSRGAGVLPKELLLPDLPQQALVLPGSPLWFSLEAAEPRQLQLWRAGADCAPVGPVLAEGVAEGLAWALPAGLEAGVAYRVDAEGEAGCFVIVPAEEAERVRGEAEAVSRAYAELAGARQGCATGEVLAAAYLAGEGFAYDALAGLDALLAEGAGPCAEVERLRRAIAAEAGYPEPAR
jgi:hypothetical protein